MFFWDLYPPCCCGAFDCGAFDCGAFNSGAFGAVAGCGSNCSVCGAGSVVGVGSCIGSCVCVAFNGDCGYVVSPGVLPIVNLFFFLDNCSILSVILLLCVISVSVNYSNCFVIASE